LINIPVIARRELSTYFLSLIAYFVLTAFALAYGLVLVGLLGDAQIDPNAAAARGFDWAVTLMIFAVPIIAMRLLSEEASTGTMETLLTAPVSEGEVVLGKYLAALIFGLTMLAPVAGGCVMLATMGGLDYGPVASGLLGLYLVVAQFLAIGLLCSSLTRMQIGSAIMAFVAVLALSILGYTVRAGASGLGAALAYLAPGAHLAGFLKGIVDSRDLVYFAATTALFLFLSVTALKMRKWRSVGAALAMSIVLSVALVALVCYISTRRYARVDMTGKLRYTLHTRTRRVLRGLDRPVRVTLVNVGEEDPVMRWAYQQSQDMLEEFQALSWRVELEQLSFGIDEHRPRIDALKARVDIPESSAVFECAGRHEVVGLAKTLVPPAWRGAGVKFRGEAAFASALLKVTGVRRVRVYFLAGHGERFIEEGGAAGESVSRLAASLKDDNFDVASLNLDERGEVPEDCAVLIVPGPRVPLPEEHLAAVRDYLVRPGARAVLMLDSSAGSGRRSNLDALLSQYGIKVHQDAMGVSTVLKRTGMSVEGRHVFLKAAGEVVPIVGQGFADHPITSDLQNYTLRLTVCAPLEIEAAAANPTLSVRALLTGTKDSWGERTFPTDPKLSKYDEDVDVAPPVVAAVVVEPHRGTATPPAAGAGDSGSPVLLVLGSSQSFVDSSVESNPAHLYLLMNAVNWMAGNIQVLGIPPKDFDIHLVQITPSQRRISVLVFLVGLPVCIVVLGTAVWLVRRR